MECNLERNDRWQADILSIGCAQLHDSAENYVHVLTENFQSRSVQDRIAGPVYPVSTEDDMLPCLQALDACPKGSILLLVNNIFPSEALAGDILVTAAKKKGLAGLVVKGAVRDLSMLETFEFPVFSTEVNFVSAKTAKVPAKHLPEEVELTSVNGSIVCESGDWLVGDKDGWLIIKANYVSASIKAARVLSEREESLRIALADGVSLAELIGLHDYVSGKSPLKFDV